MAHIHEKIDFTASVYVVFENKVLLHKHVKTGHWLPPGGHIEPDEDANQAAIREVKEESGLAVELLGYPGIEYGPVNGEIELIPPRFMNRHFYKGAEGHEHVDLVYFGHSKGGDFQPEEGVGEMRWFTKEDIETHTKELLPRIRMYALAALKELAS